MSRGLRFTEEDWALWRAKRVAEQMQDCKQIDVHMAVAKPKQFTKNEKAKLKVRGIKPVVRIPTEHEEQCAVIQWCDQHPIAKHIFAIPNGSHKSPAMAAKFKREGLRSGVPDLFLPVPVKGFPYGYHGLFIEMKRVKGSVLSEAQDDYIERLQMEGYKVEVCKGAEAAIEAIKKYLDTRKLED